MTYLQHCLIMIQIHTIQNQVLCVCVFLVKEENNKKNYEHFLKHPQFVLGFAFNLKIETFPECLTTCNIIRPHAAPSNATRYIASTHCHTHTPKYEI